MQIGLSMVDLQVNTGLVSTGAARSCGTGSDAKCEMGDKGGVVGLNSGGYKG